MKNETLEDELRLLKLDLQNIRKEYAKNLVHLEGDIEFLRAHMKIAFAKLSMSIRQRYQCRKCEGSGTIYISPISDCGQSNKCGDCDGQGIVWI